MKNYSLAYMRRPGLRGFLFACIAATLSLAPSRASADKFCVTPYLQHPDTNAMTIIFFTDTACNATVKAWPDGGSEAGALTLSTTGVWAQALTNSVFHLNKNDKVEKNWYNNSLYKHRVRLEGLEPGCVYDYTVTIDGVGGETYSNKFRTAPDKNTPIRFVSYADSETTDGHFKNYALNLARMQSRRPDLITAAGDLTARGGIQSHWDEFWRQNAGKKYADSDKKYTDILGAIPMLTAIGNHDLFDNADHTVSGGWFHDRQGEVATDKFLSYFEFNSNGVEYAFRDGTTIPETRDMSQLFHREDYGPVTLIFLDTNNGQDGDTDADHDKDTNYDKPGDSQHTEGGMDRRKGARHPDFNPGSLQYTWLTNNLADAQRNSRFTFVFNHHCPYSIGGHNKSWTTGEDSSSLPVRILTETMVRYGVDGWICGHDELLEHSITNGYEVLPNGEKRRHTLSVYDLGCSGDSPRSSSGASNPLAYWQGSGNYGGTGSYGFLETDVTTNANGRWTCTITPVQGSTGNYLSSQIIYVENPDRGEDENDLVYAQAQNSGNKIIGASATKPADWLEFSRGDEPGEDPDPSGDHDITIAEIAAGTTTNFTTKAVATKWTCNSSDANNLPASIVRNANGTATITLSPAYGDLTARTVTVSGDGVVVMTITVAKIGPRVQSVEIGAGKQFTDTCTFHTSKNWSVEYSGQVTAKLSANSGTSVGLTITAGNSAGTGTVTVYRTSTSSGNIQMYVYNVTVTGGSAPEEPEPEAVSLVVGGDAKSISISGGNYGTSWSTSVEGTNPSCVKLSKTSGTGSSFSFTITGVSVGTAKVVVKKNGVAVNVYNVTVVKGPDIPKYDGKIHLCVGDTVKLSEKHNSSYSWSSQNSASSIASISGLPSGTAKNASYTIKALKAGSTTISVKHSSTTYSFPVVVEAARRIRVGEEAIVSGYSNPKESGGSTWTLSATPAGSVSIDLLIQSKTNVVAKLTGKAVGNNTVSLGNLSSSSGSEYELAVCVCDTPVVSGTIPTIELEAGNALSSVADGLSAIAMKDSAGTAVSGTWAWVNPATVPAVSDAYGATFTPTKEYYDAVTITVPVAVGNAKEVVYGDPIVLVKGGSCEIAEPTWESAWSASSSAAGVASVASGGAAGERPVVTAAGAGKATIRVENEAVRYVYEVTVHEVKTLDDVVLEIGKSTNLACQSVVAAAWTASSDNEAVATVTSGGAVGTKFTPTVTAHAPGSATVTIRNDFAVYTVDVVVASFVKGKVNLAYGGEGAADEVTLYWWYEKMSGTKSLFAPRHYKAEVSNVTGAGIGIDTVDTTAAACSATRIAAIAAEGGASVVVNRSSDPVKSDGSLGGTPQKSVECDVVSTPKRVVYVGKTVPAYCWSNESAAWTCASADEDVATVKYAGTASAEVTAEISGVGVGLASVTVGNAYETRDLGISGSWPTDATAEQKAIKTASVTNGVVYKLWIEVRDVPHVDGALSIGSIKEGQSLANATIGGTMKDGNGNVVEGGFAWRDGAAVPALADGDATEYEIDFTPAGMYYDAVTLKATVHVGAADVLPELAPYDPGDPTAVAKADEEARGIVKSNEALAANIATANAYNDFRAWVEKNGISHETAVSEPYSFFSFATYQDKVMTAVEVAEVVVDGAVRIDGLEIRQADGAMQIQLAVSVEGLPVGDGARSEYLEKVFGVKGAVAIADGFSASNVQYVEEPGSIMSVDDGKVVYTVKPADKFSAARSFFYRATISTTGAGE